MPLVFRLLGETGAHAAVLADVVGESPLPYAGGTWVDEEVQLCTAGPNTLVTSRKPDDLKAYCQEAVEVFASA